MNTLTKINLYSLSNQSRMNQVTLRTLVFAVGITMAFSHVVKAGYYQARSMNTDSAYASDKATLTKGQLLFQQQCSACHNFRQKGIGPNLATVTAEVSAGWLRQFIPNAPRLIEQKDARAVRLLAQYNQVMPAFPTLSDSDVQALMAYIHQNRSKGEGASTNDQLGAALVDPIPAKITASGLHLTLTPVTTAPASAKKGPLARITKMLVLPGKAGTGQKNRVFMVDLRGTLYEMIGDSLRPYMSMPAERPGFIDAPGLASGFGSFAFHPDFYKNGLLYTTHTEKARSAPADFAYPDSINVALQWVLTEWKLPNPAAASFAGTGRELMRINMVSVIHGVQEITFNPLDKPGSAGYGLLYIGVGDGGATENGHYTLCADRNNVWGKVLRINPGGRNSKNGRYGIPAANPYGNEVFCRGFRNPNRIAWSPDGVMLISDIGQANMEEVNIGIAGKNYGWPEREGTFVINHRGAMSKLYALPDNDATLGYTYPVIQYDHDEGNAVSGGFVYPGNRIPLLKGKYIFGDIVNGRVYYAEISQMKLGRQASLHEFSLDIGGSTTTFQQVCGAKKTDMRLGIGLDQTLYLFTKTDGRIYRVDDCTSGK